MSDSEYVNLGVEFTREQRYGLVKDWLALNKKKIKASSQYLKTLKSLRVMLSQQYQSSLSHDSYTRGLRNEYSDLLAAYTLVKRGKIRISTLKSDRWKLIVPLLPWKLRSAYDYAGYRFLTGQAPSVKDGFVNQIMSLLGF